MQALLTVPGVAGDFNVRVVYEGDNYGRDLCLLHGYAEPLVEFYDARYPHTELGQFVSRYYIGTLLEGNDGVGLDLHMGEPSWTIPADSMDLVRSELRSIAGMEDDDYYDEPDVDELTEWMDFDPDC